jgi:methylisocitrate lyase
MKKQSPGNSFREAVAKDKPLQVIGTINAYTALMAEKMGVRAIYLSGAGVANASYGLPDLGVTTLDNVLTDAKRITEAASIPLLADIDTGWGNAFMIERTIRSMERAGVAAVHIEDQIFEKRCGHRFGKAVVSKEEMLDRLKAALDARTDTSFVIMARTDAYGSEGMEKTLERCKAYEEAGADMHFIEALSSLDEYRRFTKSLTKPVLANMTEFGKTPLFNRKELAEAGVSLILYPLSAFRAMNLAALRVYKTILSKGTQLELLDQMQTREELYGFLDYQAYEEKMDQWLEKKRGEHGSD